MNGPDGGFDLEQIIRDGAFGYPEGDVIALELRESPELAYHLHETRLSEDQVIDPDANGTSRLTATVRDTAHLKWWLLGLGANVEVLTLGALRDEVALELNAARAPYRSGVQQ